MCGEELERDAAFELRVLGLMDDAHAAFAELLDDAVVRDGSTDDHGLVLPLVR